MKNLFFILSVFFIASTAFAQSSASFQDGQLVLESDNDVVLTEYKVDISPLNLSSEEVAKRFFASINSNLESYKLKYDEGVAYLTLYPQYVGDVKWSLAQWNNYFFERAEHYNNALTAAKSR